jgi:hypothetical protein
LLAVAVGSTPALGARLVFYGWGMRESAWVREHWREMERMPFDGTGISVYASPGGVSGDPRNFGTSLFGARAFRPDDVRRALDDLRVPRWTRFTDNFLPTCLSGEQDDDGFRWDDERRWHAIRTSWKTAAWLARAGGLRGIVLDPEHYGARLFAWPAMREREHGDFEARRRVVRRRGHELGVIAGRVFPKMVVLALYGHTIALESYQRGRLATAEYGLYPDFLDGLLDGAAGRLTLIDGFEFAYSFRSRVEFERARREIVEEAIVLTALPHRYRDDVRVGFGIWLDRGGAERWFPDEPAANWFTPAALRDALGHALALTDDYVWLYAQRPKFFPPSELPQAYVEAIAEARQASSTTARAP